MAILSEDFFKERKYPFIFTLLVLLICVTVLFFTTTTTSTSNPVAFYSDIEEKKPLDPSQVLADSTSNPEEQKLPPKEQGLPKKEAIDNVSIDWKLCEGVTVDHIPCLDNFEAIKNLKSRRHMEHRERHCPDTSFRCLLPLPKGYKVPVPWPKSRDMVRLIVLR
jgi:hypothetical protein